MLQAMRIFIKVVELGSFSKAAIVLNMAPSSVARSVDSLETELSVTLFKRSTRQLKLTEKGHVFLQGTSKLLADADGLFASLRDNNLEPSGHLNISVFESFGRLRVLPILPEFVAQYPKIKVNIELENKVVDLIRENVDLGIRIGTPLDSNLKARMLISNQKVGLYATKRYLETYGVPQHPNDLKQHNCLLLGRERQSTFWYFKESSATKKPAIHKIHVEGNIRSKGGTPLLEAALQSCGVSVFSHWMVSEYLSQGQLVECLSDFSVSLTEETSGDVYAVYPRTRYPNPLVRLFIDFLLSKLDLSSVAS